MLTLHCNHKAETEIGNGQIQYQISLTEVREDKPATNPTSDANEQPPQFINIAFTTTDKAKGEAFVRGQDYQLMPVDAA